MKNTLLEVQVTIRVVNRSKLIERIAKLRPIDDIFMYQVFKDNVPLTELLLRRIIGTHFKVQRVSVQYDIELHAVGARSLRLDVLATDVAGNVYDIEIQRDDRGALPKRARYYSSALDVAQLKKGEDFSKLHDTYLIFITEHDLWRDGEAVHVIERMDTKTNKTFGDGTHIIYVNGQYHADDSIGELMHDFLCEQPDNMRIPLMAETCGYLKNTQEGLETMCQIMEDYAKEYAEEYAKEYAEEYAREYAEEYAKEYVKEVLRENALIMIKAGKLSHKDISEYLRIPKEEVEELAKTLS